MVLTIDSGITAVGYQYLDVSNGAVGGLTPPNGATMALIAWRSGVIYWRDDAPPALGNPPVGQPFPENSFIWYRGNLNAIKFIGNAAPNQAVSVSYYSS